MEKFRINITDLETGETKIDEKTDCIIGAYSKNEGEVASVAMVEGKTIDLMHTIKGTQAVIDELFKRDSKLKALSTLTELVEKRKVTERTDESSPAKEDAQCRNSES